METHGRTGGASSPATGERRPRLVGGEKPWSRWLRGRPPDRPRSGGASVRETPSSDRPSGRHRAGGRLGLALSEQIPASAADPEHLGARVTQPAGESSHSGGARATETTRQGCLAGAIPQRLERRLATEDERTLACTIPASWPPPEHDATGTVAGQRTRVARHARPEVGSRPGRGETRVGASMERGRGQRPARVDSRSCERADPGQQSWRRPRAARGRGREPEARGHASASVEGPQLEPQGRQPPRARARALVEPSSPSGQQSEASTWSTRRCEELETTPVRTSIEQRRANAP
jgi:hypothetical protein